MKRFLISFTIFVLGFFVKSASIHAATLFLTPQSGTFFVGSTFEVSVFVDTKNEYVNAIQADLKFPPDKLQIVSPTAGRSVIQVWIDQPSFSNDEGLASFKGGIPSPGINSSGALVSTITFRITSPGSARISFTPASKVLLNDGKGTNALSVRAPADYFFQLPAPEGPKIFSSTHPDSEKWSRNNNVIFSWAETHFAGDTYSYTFNQNPEDIPDNIPEGSNVYKIYNDVSDGEWYFHIKAYREGRWSGVSHYLVRIDRTEPADFKPAFTQISSNLFVNFLTTDAASGINHYEVKVVPQDRSPQNLFFTEAASPYALPPQRAGRYQIFVRAVDQAGNFRESKVAAFILTPSIISITHSGLQIGAAIIPWPIFYLLIILIIIFVAYWLYHFKYKPHDLAGRVSHDIAKLETKVREDKALLKEHKKEDSRIQKVKRMLERFKNFYRKLNK